MVIDTVHRCPDLWVSIQGHQPASPTPTPSLQEAGFFGDLQEDRAPDPELVGAGVSSRNAEMPLGAEGETSRALLGSRREVTHRVTPRGQLVGCHPPLQPCNVPSCILSKQDSCLEYMLCDFVQNAFIMRAKREKCVFIITIKPAGKKWILAEPPSFQLLFLSEAESWTKRGDGHRVMSWRD